MKSKNLCDRCRYIRGLCCFYNVELKGKDDQIFNVILSNQHCKFLDTKTMNCTVYEHRYERQPICLPIEKSYNTGGLPKGCLYLKGHPERESNPKVEIRTIIENLSTKNIMEYNVWNNILDIEQFAIKNKD